jgi:hypothetical protein
MVLTPMWGANGPAREQATDKGGNQPLEDEAPKEGEKLLFTAP